jgi:hypothetical protein
MEAWEHLPVLITLMLAMAAGLISSDSEARQEVASFVRAVLRPQTADLRTAAVTRQEEHHDGW